MAARPSAGGLEELNDEIATHFQCGNYAKAGYIKKVAVVLRRIAVKDFDAELNPNRSNQDVVFCVWQQFEPASDAWPLPGGKAALAALTLTTRDWCFAALPMSNMPMAKAAGWPVGYHPACERELDLMKESTMAFTARSI